MPEYKVDETSVTVVVPRESSYEAGERLFGNRGGLLLSQVREEYDPQQNIASVPFPEPRRFKTNASLEDIWLYINQRRNETFSQMLADLDVGRCTLAYRLEALKERGLIVRTGNTRSAVWNAVTR
ncbi:MAG: hypothetical protein IJE88_05745 [Akkermansia sp.]|nr:hypothetical protein [Akkermansia sp.]